MESADRTAVQAMSPGERFAWFVRKAADLERVWGLHAEGWATTDDGRGGVALAVWPDRDFAAACASGQWAGHVPRPISLEDFLTQWLPDLAALSRSVTVFPTSQDDGVPISPGELAEAIHRELWQAEGK
jgi:hypothetical protein